MNEVFEARSVMSVDKLLPDLERPRSAPPRMVVPEEKLVPPGVILVVNVELVRGASVLLVFNIEGLADTAILVGDRLQTESYWTFTLTR